ncbi:MAG: DNA-binding protein HU [Moraxellaceae bacterium]|nr:MAG: DNA-binding protein HU [Moraxellaceae bacterium]
MIKTDIEAQLAEQLDVSKVDARDLLNVILDEITLALSRNHRVSFIGFGTFDVRPRAAREGRNPQTGASIKIPASNGVRFKPGKALKDAVAAS